MSRKNKRAVQGEGSFYNLPLFEQKSANSQQALQKESNDTLQIVRFTKRESREESARRDKALKTILDHASTLDW